jgi:hypothetical protein
MAATSKAPLLFSRVTYGSMIVSAVGLLATVAYGMGDPLLRVYAEVLLVWILIALVAIWSRLTAVWWRAMDTKLAQIESAAKRQ